MPAKNGYQRETEKRVLLQKISSIWLSPFIPDVRPASGFFCIKNDQTPIEKRRGDVIWKQESQ